MVLLENALQFSVARSMPKVCYRKPTFAGRTQPLCAWLYASTAIHTAGLTHPWSSRRHCCLVLGLTRVSALPALLAVLLCYLAGYKLRLILVLDEQYRPMLRDLQDRESRLVFADPGV